MNFDDNQLDQLFSQARKEKPIASFDETTQAFAVATVAAAGGVLATKGLLKLLTIKKWIIMFSTIAVITTTTLVISMSSSPEHVKKETLNEKNPSLIITLDDTSKEKKTTELPILEIAEVDPMTPVETIAIIAPNVIEDIEKPSETLEVSSPSIIIESIPNDTLAVTIIPYSMRFDITEKTTKEELEGIQKQAKSAGIDFTFSAKHKHGDLKKLKYNMSLKEEGADGFQYIMSKVNIEGEFAYTLAWATAADGSATQLYCGDTEDFDERIAEDAQTNAMEINTVMPELDLVLMQIDSISNCVEATFDINMTEIQEEINELQEELEEVMEELHENELEELRLELDDLSTELSKILSEQLNGAEKQEENAEEQEEGAEEEGSEQEEGDEEGSEIENEEE